ncbi:hypothetical protein [Methylobacterium oryzisoli]|uniref:hypothetical protein n=1 Tax=Methylobacterium oryzisoli TaxID=3385502 RepID=UPI0038920973
MKFGSLVISIWMQSSLFAAVAHAGNGDRNIVRVMKAVDECKNAEAANPNQATLTEMESAVCFRGRIGRDADRAIIPLLSRKDKIFIVNSIGGDGIAAAKIGLHILENRLDVAAHGLCLSSCASYFFLAGFRKYLMPDTILAWHGAPRAEPSFRQKLLDNDGRLQLVYQLSQQFFDAAKVDRRLALGPDLIHPGCEAWMAGWDSRNVHFWTWSRRALEQRFHVPGIETYWYPDDSKIIADLGRKHGFEVLVGPK